MSGLSLFRKEADEIEIRLAAWKTDDYVRPRAAFVVRGGPSIPELLVEDRVDPASCPLGESGAFEGICQEWVSRPGWGYQQVVEANSFGKAARIGDLDLFGSPLDVHRSKPGVVPMNKRIGESFPKG